MQSLGVERTDNVVGDIQPTEFTEEKKDLLVNVTKDIGVAELLSGEYITLLQPWLDVSRISDDQAYALLIRL